MRKKTLLATSAALAVLQQQQVAQSSVIRQGERPIRPSCAVKGWLGPGAMCGQVIVGLKECGAEIGGCKHQVPKEPTDA